MPTNANRRHRISIPATMSFKNRLGESSLARIILGVCTCGAYCVRADEGELYWSDHRCGNRARRVESSAKFGDLTAFPTGQYIRPATKTERQRSIVAATLDGGLGLIRIAGLAYYVKE